MRRTAMYFHSLDWASAPCKVRAPQLTVPATGRLRITLTPSGFKAALSESLSAPLERSTTPRSWVETPAGDFQTPCWPSTVAYSPASVPLLPTSTSMPERGRVGVDDLQPREVDSRVLVLHVVGAQPLDHVVGRRDERRDVQQIEAALVVAEARDRSRERHQVVGLEVARLRVDGRAGRDAEQVDHERLDPPQWLQARGEDRRRRLVGVGSVDEAHERGARQVGDLARVCRVDAAGLRQRGRRADRSRGDRGPTTP